MPFSISCRLQNIVSRFRCLTESQGRFLKSPFWSGILYIGLIFLPIFYILNDGFKMTLPLVQREWWHHHPYFSSLSSGGEKRKCGKCRLLWWYKWDFLTWRCINAGTKTHGWTQVVVFFLFYSACLFAGAGRGSGGSNPSSLVTVFSSLAH